MVEVRLPVVTKYVTATAGRVLDLIVSPSYCMQPKIDGCRLIIAKSTQGISCYNKRLEPAAAPKWLLDAVATLPEGSWTFDGELTDTGYHIFDITAMPGTEGHEELPFDERQLMLMVVMKGWRHPKIHRVETWFDPHEKFMHLLHLRKAGAEGVVLRPRESSPHFRGQVYKYKFYQSVDAIVTGLRVDGKEAITVAVLHKGREVNIGKAKVDLQTQDSMSTFTTVVEIRHRGLSRHIEDNGKMIEPVFMRVRYDKRPYSCSSDQLQVRGQPARYDGDEPSYYTIEEIIGIERNKAIQLIKGDRINDNVG